MLLSLHSALVTASLPNLSSQDLDRFCVCCGYCRTLGTVLLVAVPPLLVAYLSGLSPLPEERRLDAVPGDVGSGACACSAQGLGIWVYAGLQ